MVKGTSHLSKLIFWEIILLFILIMIFTYAPMIIELDSLGEILSTFLKPALIILFMLIITKIFITILEPVFKRSVRRYIAPNNVNSTWQFISYLIWIAAIIILTFILVGNLFTIGVFFVILILIIVLISHRAIANFAGWLHIIFSNPIKKDDLIEIDGIKGQVIEVTPMSVVLEEKSTSLKDTGYTGRIVNIPNSFIFSKPVFSISSTDSLVWDEISVLLPAKTDHLLAEDTIAEVAKVIVGPIMKKNRQEMTRKVSSSEEVISVPTTEFSLGTDGVLIVLRYFCRVSERSEVRSAISEGILKEFKKHRIDITFKK